MKNSFSSFQDIEILLEKTKPRNFQPQDISRQADDINNNCNNDNNNKIIGASAQSWPKKKAWYMINQWQQHNINDNKEK